MISSFYFFILPNEKLSRRTGGFNGTAGRARGRLE
jgi:hypothetical protein